jgi:hypothetical protein
MKTIRLPFARFGRVSRFVAIEVAGDQTCVQFASVSPFLVDRKKPIAYATGWMLQISGWSRSATAPAERSPQTLDGGDHRGRTFFVDSKTEQLLVVIDRPEAPIPFESQWHT